MKTVITAVAALLLATPAAADIYLVAETDDYIFYADEKTVKTVAPGKSRVWLDIIKKTTSDKNGPYSEKRLNEFDCGKDTYRMITSVEYDADDDVTETYSFADNPRTVDVVPGSAAEGHYDFVCTPSERAAMFKLPADVDLVMFTREVEKVHAEKTGN